MTALLLSLTLLADAGPPVAWSPADPPPPAWTEETRRLEAAARVAREQAGVVSRPVASPQADVRPPRNIPLVLRRERPVAPVYHNVVPLVYRPVAPPAVRYVAPPAPRAYYFAPAPVRYYAAPAASCVGGNCPREFRSN